MRGNLSPDSLETSHSSDPNSHGTLSGWSHTIDLSTSTSRSQHITPFMALELLLSPNAKRRPRHDVESFFWIVWWILKSRTAEAKDQEDLIAWSHGTAREIYLTKSRFIMQPAYTSSQVDDPLYNLLETLNRAVRLGYYALRWDPEADAADRHINHARFLAQIQETLANTPGKWIVNLYDSHIPLSELISWIP